MPGYVCGNCGEAFGSKQELAAHQQDCEPPTGETMQDHVSSLVTHIKGLSRKQLITAISIFLMSTLFMGTAFFYSSLAPAQDTAAQQDTTPPTGRTIQTTDDIPRRGDAVPSQFIVNRELSEDVQVYLLARHYITNNPPVVLLQYNCETACPGLVSNLTQVAQDFQGYVYVAPYSEMDSRIAVTAFRRPVRMETFERDRIDDVVCSALGNQPLACIFGGASGNQTAGNATGGGGVTSP